MNSLFLILTFLYLAISNDSDSRTEGRLLPIHTRTWPDLKVCLLLDNSSSLVNTGDRVESRPTSTAVMRLGQSGAVAFVFPALPLNTSDNQADGWLIRWTYRFGQIIILPTSRKYLWHHQICWQIESGPTSTAPTRLGQSNVKLTLDSNFAASFQNTMY